MVALFFLELEKVINLVPIGVILELFIKQSLNTPYH
jgi:hypothetical protein